MIKSNNPFSIWGHALEILRFKGVDPQASWATHILGVMMNKVYGKDTHHYSLDIHLDNEGFDMVDKILRNTPVYISEHSSSVMGIYYQLTLEPSELLRLYTLKEVRSE